MEKKRVCKKCLLSELDDKRLLEEIREAVTRLGDNNRVSETEYASRLDVCKNCDYLNEGTCGACGCYVELRAAARTGKCPYKKWDRMNR